MNFLFSIEVFQSVVEHGNFARAANSLKLTPGMVSIHIANLEKELGARLFSRTTRRLILTDSGTAFLERSNRIVQKINQATSIFSRSSSTLSGYVSVELTSTMATSLVIPILREFSELYPNIELELNHTKNAYSNAYDGFDVMFRLGSIEDSAVINKELGRVYSIVAASPAYLANHEDIRQPSDLLKHHCLRYIDPITAEIREWIFEKDEESQSIQGNGKLLFNQAESTVHAALLGLGIVYTTNYHINRYINDGKLISILREWNCPGPKLSIVCRKRSSLTHAALAFMDFVANHYPVGRDLIPLDPPA